MESKKCTLLKQNTILITLSSFTSSNPERKKEEEKVRPT